MRKCRHIEARGSTLSHTLVRVRQLDALGKWASGDVPPAQLATLCHHCARALGAMLDSCCAPFAKEPDQ